MRHSNARVVCALILFIFLLLYGCRLFQIFKHSNESLEDWFFYEELHEIDSWNYYYMDSKKGSHAAVQENRPLTILEIKQQIHNYNKIQRVLNENLFGPLTNDSVIILIQVHTRINYLKYLIFSLSLAGNISDVLLVFSHDYFDNDINKLVQSIGFCKVIQIFYPYSQQTHPDDFPGADPIDCQQNIAKEHASNGKCNNNTLNFTLMKHHWWWKANIVFNGLSISKYYTGPVLFLEEDHYVADDFIHVLNLMRRSLSKLCSHCNVLSLGNYLKAFQYFTYHKKVEIVPWYVSKYNMGFAFNRSTWSSIQRCAHFFCKYNDYNWDWSLQHVSNWCLQHKLMALAIKGPRVFHIGNCGFHHKSDDCTSSNLVARVNAILDLAYESHQLYPTSLVLVKPLLLKKPNLGMHFKGNGRWNNPRDHQLCLNMTLSNDYSYI